MSNYRRARALGAVYFFTLATLGRKPILTDEAVRIALRHAIRQVREPYPFAIEGWVLLPDHMHCLWRLPEGDAEFGKRWGLIKRYVTRELGRGDRILLPQGAGATKAACGSGVSGNTRYAMRPTAAGIWTIFIGIRSNTAT